MDTLFRFYGDYILLYISDDVAAQQAAEDFLSDLDSVVAQQIDDRFKEIMLKKKVKPSATSLLPRPANTPTPVLAPGPTAPQHDSTLSPFPRTTAGYGTDNDSVKTEDFESRFQSLLVMSDGRETTSGETTPKQLAGSSAGVTPTSSPNRSRSVSPERL
ncbi:hypothetical protein BaRGS_00036829, partial [Batillaria attramentaria]